MKERLVADLTSEKDNINSQLKEKRGQEVELDKALVSVRKDISLLEGRLLEVTAIIDYVGNLSQDEETQEPETLDN